MTIAQLVGRMQSGMRYLGAHDLKELKKNAHYVRVTAAGERESSPHNVISLRRKRFSWNRYNLLMDF